MNKTTTWILIVVAFIVGGLVGFFIERQRATDKMESYKMEAQKMVDDEKMAAAKMMVTPTAMMEKNSVYMMAKDAKLGEILKSEKGMTLYTYDKDTAGKSTCTGQCAVNWPPYDAAGPVPSSMPSHIGTLTRADGKTQYTWDDKPLYFYIKDKDSGDAYGDGVGEVWHVVKQ